MGRSTYEAYSRAKLEETFFWIRLVDVGYEAFLGVSITRPTVI